jgi:glycosyltransferase involved in cell wall biosynthesis
MDYSVIIRTKNSEKTIKACLEGLLSQTIKPLEIIVVDSGSRDNTLPIVKEFGVVIIDYPKGQKFNYSKALNIGIAKTISPFILILSSHVEFLDFQSIYFMHNVFVEDEQCITVSMVRTDKKNKINGSSMLNKNKITLRDFKGQAMYNFCSLIRKESWNEHNFDEKIMRCEDQEWAYYFLKKNFHAIIIKEPQIYYDNSYYNFQKDLWDIIVIGETVYPYYNSKYYLFELLKKSFKYLKKGNNRLFIREFRMFLGLFSYKYLRKKTIESVYNNKLE